MNKVLMMKFFLFLYLILFFGCENDFSNTLSDGGLGDDGVSLSDYFYNLDEDFNVKFHKYGLPITINLPDQWSDEDTLNYTNYTDLVLTIDPSNVENYTSVEIFDETSSGTCCDNSGLCDNGLYDNQVDCTSNGAVWTEGCIFFDLVADDGKCIGGSSHGADCDDDSDCYSVTCTLGVCGSGSWSTFEECCTQNEGNFTFNDDDLTATCTHDDDDDSNTAEVELSVWTPSALDANGNGVYESSEYVDGCIDINQDGVLGKSRYFDIPKKQEVIIKSATYTNLDNLIWDTFDDKNRYSQTLNATLSYQDYTFDLAVEPEVKDIADASGCPEGTVFVDGVESFNFCDVGNGEYDVGEDFTDLDGDGDYDSGEEYIDEGDGQWTDVANPYDSTVFFVQVDPDLDIVGLSYFDPSEYIQKDTTYISDYLRFEKEFTLSRQVVVDSLMYRISTDCNVNGTWDNTKEDRYFIEYGSYNSETCVNASDDAEWGRPWSDLDLDETCFEYYDEEGCLAQDDSYSWDNSNNLKICFTDEGNGIWDDAEVFLDLNNSSDCDCDRAGTVDVEEDEEPFEDRNCNQAWDGAEVIVAASGTCVLGTLTTVGDVSFCDLGNRVWDDVESFYDSNGNGFWDCADEDLEDGIEIDECEGLYMMSSSPNVIVVDYLDDSNPEAVAQINLFQDIVSRNGLAYNEITFPDYSSAVNDDAESISIPEKYYYFEDVLDTITITETKFTDIDKIDSVHTVFSNDVIDMSELSSDGQEFSITKIQSEKVNDSNAALIDREYYYLIFKYDSNGDLVQLKHPSYFYPIDPTSTTTAGFYTTEQALSDGFWFSEFPKLDTYFYTHNGLLRDGEYITNQETVSTSVADYFVERYDSTSYVGDFTLENVRDEDGYKIQYSDVYKIRRTVFYTMIGTGLEFGERNTTWLAPNVGIIRDLVEIHWIDPFWETEDPDYGITDDKWQDISLIELQSYNATPSSSESVLERVFSQNSTVNSLNKFKYLPELDYEEYIKKHTFGLQSYSIGGN